MPELSPGRFSPVGSPIPNARKYWYWSCGLTCHPSAHYCPDCAAPLHTPEVRLLRYEQFLVGEVRRQQEAGRLTEEEARRLLAGAPEHLSELRGGLDRARLVVSSR